MSNNKKSSVEWLDNELASLNFDYLTGLIDNKEYNERHQSIKEQAKAMHKEEIEKVSEDWWNEGASYVYNGQRKYNSFDEYYNETFGGNNEQ